MAGLARHLDRLGRPRKRGLHIAEREQRTRQVVEADDPRIEGVNEDRSAVLGGIVEFQSPLEMRARLDEAPRRQVALRRAKKSAPWSLLLSAISISRAAWRRASGRFAP